MFSPVHIRVTPIFWFWGREKIALELGAKQIWWQWWGAGNEEFCFETSRYQHIFQSYKETEKSTWLSRTELQLTFLKQGIPRKASWFALSLPRKMMALGYSWSQTEFVTYEIEWGWTGWWKVLHRLPRVSTTCVCSEVTTFPFSSYALPSHFKARAFPSRN